MSSMNVLLLMQLLPEPGRPDRRQTEEVSPCDLYALSCAARLRAACPDSRLCAAVIIPAEASAGDAENEGSSVRAASLPAADAGETLARKALSAGADEAVLVRAHAELPHAASLSGDPGLALLRFLETHFGVSFSLVLTGFHMNPLLTAEAARRAGLSFMAGITGLLPDSPATLLAECKDRETFRIRKLPLPLLAEIVRSPRPFVQPSVSAIAASLQRDIAVLELQEKPELRETLHRLTGLRNAPVPSLPIFFDAKKTVPSQIAKELFSILSARRLLPDGASDTMPADVRLHQPDESSPAPLRFADRIVSVGRGAISPENAAGEVLALAGILADRLQASIGASKAAVDLGLLPPSGQIGKTGSIAAPDLYVACGISGSIQHQDGMRNARFIVAINTDPAAPIFRIADVGICGEVREILQALAAELSIRSGSATPQSFPRPSGGT